VSFEVTEIEIAGASTAPEHDELVTVVIPVRDEDPP
jgi:hypothetical protein